MPRKPKTTLKDRRIVVASVQNYLRFLYLHKPIITPEVAEQIKTAADSLTKILD